jgi:hypothetical protein
MTKNIVSVAAALLGAGALVAGCNFEQPDAGCIVQDASFANWYAKYDLKPGSTVEPGCASTVLKGEELGVFKFTNPDQPGQTKLTIRPEGLASRAERDPGDPYLQTAVGDLSDEPVESFCAASNFSGAEVLAGPRAADPEHEIEPEAATNITYTFDNVKVYSAPRAPGTQLTGELSYTRDNCTTEYVVRAIWPAAECDPDEEDPCGEGSGVNPDFNVECDRELLHCVPVGAIPAFKDEE